MDFLILLQIHLHEDVNIYRQHIHVSLLNRWDFERHVPADRYSKSVRTCKINMSSILGSKRLWKRNAHSVESDNRFYPRICDDSQALYMNFIVNVQVFVSTPTHAIASVLINLTFTNLKSFN